MCAYSECGRIRELTLYDLGDITLGARVVDWVITIQIKYQGHSSGVQNYSFFLRARQFLPSKYFACQFHHYEEEEPQKPVAIVQPTGPLLPTKTKTKARKKARLNGLIDRLAAKNCPTKPCQEATSADEKIHRDKKSDTKFELNFDKYNVKTKDGDLGKITILHRNMFEQIDIDCIVITKK